MKNLSGLFHLSLFIITFFSTLFSCNLSDSKAQWPEVTYETKPWTRWWWMGNTLTKEGITQAMEEYQKAGIGGLEITPIYGVKGYEDQFINYLSPEWVELLTHTLKEAERLGFGIDMATGSGWPFGGPWINDQYACKDFSSAIYILEGGQTLSEPVCKVQKPYVTSYVRQIDISDVLYPISANKNLQELALEKIQFEKTMPLIALMAYSNNGEILNLSEKVNPESMMEWTAPEGIWILYAIFMGWHGKMVERAAPGGEGNVLDHFSKEAIHYYLSTFDSALNTTDISYLRAFFNDSYEVDDAKGESNFTPLFFDEFKIRKGYDLRNHLDKFLATDSSEEKSRIICDYREVISTLLLENFTQPWRAWAKSKDAIIRNQAHGSPANILDLYAASNIPETEGEDIEGMKFASSAANISGKRLTSSETATWLDEHFCATLAKVKHAVDNCFLGGINHIVYHGTAYSPEQETWPGWMFYAAVHFGPTNTIWKDLPQLNTYITRCQSFLQKGKSSNDILVYYPVYDKWSEIFPYYLLHFKPGLSETTASIIGDSLLKYNYSFDYISDRQLCEVIFKNGKLSTGYTEYQVIIVPKTIHMPESTMLKLLDLAKKGATVLFEEKLPETIPGYANLEERIKEYNQLLGQIIFSTHETSLFKEAYIEKGKIVIFKELNEALKLCNVQPVLLQVPYAELRAVKRQNEQGICYFIVNHDEKLFFGNVEILNTGGYYVHFNPMNGEISKMNYTELTNGNIQFRLRLEKGESCLLQQYRQPVQATPYKYFKHTGTAKILEGEWTLTFTSGGPVLPKEMKFKGLGSWTENIETPYFSGTAIYSTTFLKPDVISSYWMLDLGTVHESAVVKLNCQNLGTLICPPFKIIIKNEQLAETNTLEIEVTNLMANRIIFLEKEGINYKRFYNVNFPPKYRENRNKERLFDASGWEPFASGLLGPVTLTPIELEGNE